jgi:hypothetical protein
MLKGLTQKYLNLCKSGGMGLLAYQDCQMPAKSNFENFLNLNLYLLYHYPNISWWFLDTIIFWVDLVLPFNWKNNLTFVRQSWSCSFKERVRTRIGELVLEEGERERRIAFDNSLQETVACNHTLLKSNVHTYKNESGKRQSKQICNFIH